MRLLLTILFFAPSLIAQLAPPATITAGAGTTIGKGKGELLVFGPDTAIRRKVNGSIELKAEELTRAGRYVAILDDEKKVFYVQPAAPRKLSFIARPSRVPVSQPDVVIGVAFVFDDHQNLVLQ